MHAKNAIQDSVITQKERRLNNDPLANNLLALLGGFGALDLLCTTELMVRLSVRRNLRAGWSVYLLRPVLALLP